MKGKKKTIKVDYLARVEGEGALHIEIQDNKLQDVKLKIFEPPRFFEAFLRGRSYSEAPDITARICGICPVAYQMSAVHAMEQALDVKVDGPLRALRRLLYCGEWIESHVLHIYMLHAPDFLGYQDAISMAKKYPQEVKRGLRLKKAGNEILKVLGGREIHPINVRVGGFFKVPTKRDLQPLAEELKWARDAALQTVEWAAKLPIPDFEQNYEFVALRHDDEYPFNEGRLVSNNGLDIDIANFSEHFIEEHVAYSNALHCVHKDHGPYLVGPLARYSLNFAMLPSEIQQIALQNKLQKTCCNPFQSIIVRSIEVLYACDEALRIIDAYEPPSQSVVDIDVHAGVGYGCTEAPRGICYHRYEIDDKGMIRDARIVPPTSQNQKMIEEDLRHFVAQYIELPEDELTWRCEQAVRNYDPCISCATHFLKLHIKRANQQFWNID